MNPYLTGFVAVVSLAWFASLPAAEAGAAARAWFAYEQAMYLSGVLAIALMSLAMLLATRPAWLERPLGGMDRIYRLHKHAGILAVSFAATHWLIEMSDDLVESFFGEASWEHGEGAGLLHAMREAAESIGEWAIYVVLAMLVITLWKRFPYSLWRYLHRAMPALYLLLAFHAAWLAPTEWWQQPVGWLLAALLATGSVASAMSLGGLIGRSRRSVGSVIAVTTPAPDVTEVVCRTGERWHGHRPGQFAFVTFDRLEGAHPFTIASADPAARTVTFQIKALGDYTRGLAGRLTVGQPVTIEGPYGRFDFARHDRDARQIWIAGGIGVTPFLAWLEALRNDPASAPNVELHYCTRDREHDPFVARLEALCEALPSVRLAVHGARQDERITAQAVAGGGTGPDKTEVWFCGPQGLARSLKAGLQRLRKGGRLRFHQEAFEMR